MRAARLSAAAAMMAAFAAFADAGSGRQRAEARDFTRESIARWEADTYHGNSSGPQSFTHGDKEVVVVIGSGTFGVPTSEIVVFSGKRNGPYEKMLVRSMFHAAVRVHDDGKALVFTSKHPVLILPWTGVVLDLEQIPHSRCRCPAR